METIYSDFQLFLKKHIALSSHDLLHNCVLQLGQVTVVIFVAPATVDFGHSSDLNKLDASFIPTVTVGKFI